MFWLKSYFSNSLPNISQRGPGNISKMFDKIVIHEILPQEIFEKVLKKLSNYKSISAASRTCKHWKITIDKLDLLKNASGK